MQVMGGRRLIVVTMCTLILIGTASPALVALHLLESHCHGEGLPIAPNPFTIIESGHSHDPHSHDVRGVTAVLSSPRTSTVFHLLPAAVLSVWRSSATGDCTPAVATVSMQPPLRHPLSLSTTLRI